MKKPTFAALMLAAATTALAFTPEEEKLLALDEDKVPADQKERWGQLCDLKYMMDEGGDMVLPGTPKGTIRYVNLQKRVPVEKLTSVLEAFHSTMSYDVAIVPAETPATLTIRIVDDPTAPSLLAAPDDRWAQINVAKLGNAKTKPAYLAARTRKEMLRAYTALVNGSSYGAPLFRPIRKIEELDETVDANFPIDVIMRSQSNLASLGLKSAEKGTYRSFLNAGYNIVPTNVHQKAIYDAVKARRSLDRPFPR